MPQEWGDIDFVLLLLRDGRCDASINDDELLKTACKLNEPGLVRLLLKNSRVNPATENNLPINVAFDKGYWNIVEQLLEFDCVRESLSPKRLKEITEIC